MINPNENNYTEPTNEKQACRHMETLQQIV